MKLLKKLSLFIALIVTIVAIAPAMPDAHAASGSFIFANNDIIDYVDINLSYHSESTLEGSVDVVEPSDPLLSGEVLTVPITSSLDDDFDIILIDSNYTTFCFYNFDKSLANTTTTFEIIYNEKTQMVLKVTVPGYESVTYEPDYIEYY